MNLLQWTERHPSVVILDNEDPRINAFIKTSSMSYSGWELELMKWPTPLAFLNSQNAQGFYLAWIEDGEILALSLLSIRPLTLNGRVRPVGFLGDARIAAHAPRVVKARFRKLYQDLLLHVKQIEEFQKVSIFLTVILEGNTLSEKAFARNRHGILYKPLGELRTESHLNIPLLASRFWQEQSRSLQAQVTFEPYQSPLAVDSYAADFIFDREDNVDLSQAEQIKVFGKAGNLLYSAIWLKTGYRRVELKRMPVAMEVAFSALKLPRKLEAKWISFPHFHAELSLQEKKQIVNAVLAEAQRSGRLKPWDLVLNSCAKDSLVHFFQKRFLPVTVSKIYRVQINPTPDEIPLSGVSLDPAFL